MKQPTFSVVIPTRGNTPSFVVSLQMVLEKSPPDTEVIVVVNGATGEDDGGIVAYARSRRDLVGDRLQVIDARGEIAGFASAANCGLAASTGKYLTILHDDAQVPKGWLESLRTALRIAGVTYKSSKIGYIGPVSNRAHHEQNVSEKVRVIGDPENPAQAERISAALRQADASDVVMVPNLDSFCIMMTREAYETVGGFDPAFDPAGYEDAELGLRAQRSGYLSAVCTRVFVHHIGNLTTAAFAKGQFGDLLNFDKLLLQHMALPPSQKLAVGVLVNVQVQSDLDAVTLQLERIQAIGATSLVVYDQQSVEVNGRSVRQHLEQKGLWDGITEWLHIGEHTVRNPLKERNRLLQALRATHPDWILILEPLHIPGKKVTAEVMRSLMNPKDPSTKAYRYSVRTFWGDVQHQRMDTPFGNRFDQQLFRNEPWGEYELPITTNKAPAEFSTPNALPPRNVPFTMKFIVDDHAMLDPGSLEAHGVDVGGGVVSTITVADPTLTYLLMMKNEVHELPTIVSRFHDWADRCVLVDTGSTDGGPEFLEKMGIPVIRYQCCDQASDPAHLLCDYGAARNFCLRQCSTSHVLFMDADETIAGRDFTNIPFVLQEDADVYVIAINNWMQGGGGGAQKFITYQARLFRSDPRIYYAPAIHETLEECLKKHRDALSIVRTDLLIEHYGYLRQTPEERKVKSIGYEERLLQCLKDDPNDARSMYALGQHFNVCGRVDEGDGLIAKALSLDKNFFSARQELAFRMLRRVHDLFAACPPDSIPSPAHGKMMGEVRAALAPWVGAAMVRDGA